MLLGTNAHINYDLPQALVAVEGLSAAKVVALQAPGPVLPKLAATGFGVRLQLDRDGKATARSG